jgi:hypothetical protein
MAPQLDLSWVTDDPSWLIERRKRCQLSIAAQEGLVLAARLLQSRESISTLAADLEQTQWKGIRPSALRWEDVLDDAEDVQRARTEYGEYEHSPFFSEQADKRPARWYPMKVYRRLARARTEIKQLSSGNVRTCRCGLRHQIAASTGAPGRPATTLNNACRQRAYRLRRKQGAKRNWRMDRTRR